MTPRIFIDSSVLFSAANSAKGHSRDILLMGVRGEIKLILSNYVLEETVRNLAQLKYPPLEEFEEILANAGLEIVQINKQAVLDAGKLIILKDAPLMLPQKFPKWICLFRWIKGTFLIAQSLKPISRRPLSPQLRHFKN